MAINLSQLSNVSTAATALSNLILVTPQQTIGYQPQNSPSYKKDTSTPPPAILFNYEGEQSLQLQSDITDHYIENNSAIQDQVALRPEQFTVQGFIGELNDIAPAALQPLKVIAEKLTPVAAYAPQLSVTAALAYANALQIYQVGASLVNSAVSTWSSITGGGEAGGQGVINGSGLTGANNKTQTKQQIYFQQFYGYWRNRTLFTIQTPWAVFQDMAILNLRAVQDPETRMISDFEITFKLMRFASTQSISNQQLNSANYQGRGAASASNEVNLGTSTLTPASESFLGSVAA